MVGIKIGCEDMDFEDMDFIQPIKKMCSQYN